MTDIGPAQTRRTEDDLNGVISMITDWKTIETAPNDRWVLVYCDGVQVVAKWAYNDQFYWATHQEGDNKVLQTVKPTHWVPLPEPPK